MSATEVTPITRVVIDEQVREELQPPCEAKQFQPGTNVVTRDCSRPAEWITQSRTDCGHTGPPRLRCTACKDEHLHQAAMGRVTCSTCLAPHQNASIIRLEPLR